MKKPFKLDIETNLEKQGYERIDKNIWRKRTMLGKYTIVFRCSDCGRGQEPKTLSTAELQTHYRWDCEHCPVQHITSFQQRKVSVPFEQQPQKTVLHYGGNEHERL